ncbi:MAG: 3-phosphoshikimate 1-carboxyvinyltransferase [Dehalococcoidales bacterium]|nr:3-phosphoshikimate 1-carboxyvinyltransferase [Dehalococcoidales bacterium]
MKALISKSKPEGRVIAPPSKSYTIRGLMCSALANGQSEIINPLEAADTKAARDVLERIGVKIKPQETSWHITGGNLHPSETDLFCGDSAATLRFMTAIGSLIPGRCHLVVGPSLAKRPIKALVQALKQWGVNCSCHGELAPVTIEGGQLNGGTIRLPGNISSQYISALLIVAPLARQKVNIRLTTPLESTPFVLMTLDCLREFGIKVTASPDLREFDILPQQYQPTRYTIEGDWSSASYFLAMGALSAGITVTNLNPQSRQGDRVILSWLEEMGASVEVDESAVTVRKSRLKAISANLANCIDLLPTMAMLAALADGQSELTGIARARLKESNRVAAVREGLERMGVRVTEEKNRLIITGSSPRGAVIDPRNDHRIAMAFSIPGLVAGETVINNAECVSKTFPDFWETLRSIGGKVKTDGK